MTKVRQRIENLEMRLQMKPKRRWVFTIQMWPRNVYYLCEEEQGNPKGRFVKILCEEEAIQIDPHVPRSIEDERFSEEDVKQHGVNASYHEAH